MLKYIYIYILSHRAKKCLSGKSVTCSSRITLVQQPQLTSDFSPAPGHLTPSSGLHRKLYSDTHT